MEKIFLTKRLSNVFTISEKSLNKRKVIFPIDLFIAMILDNTGILVELNNHFFNDISSLQKIALNLPKESKEHKSIFFNKSISDSTLEVLNLSIEIMHENNQIYLNENHLLKALISTTNELTNLLSKDNLNYLRNLSEKTIDLMVDLENYKVSDLDNDTFVIRKALPKDRYILYDFIKKNFSSVWADTIYPLFELNYPPVYIAILNKTIVGFSSYDVFGLSTFGPIGVLKAFRNMNLGKILLNKCLLEMKSRGDTSIIIKNAGPIEFYEKCCNVKIL